MSVVDEPVSPPVVPSQSVPPQSTSSSGGVRAFLWEMIQTVLLTLIIFLAVRAVVQNFKVEGASMEPTLHTGQYLLINKVGYARLEGTPFAFLDHRGGEADGYLFDGPTRGDIIVFRAPIQPDKDFIKRVIAVPGDTVEVRGGQVFVNDQNIDEPYIRDRAPYLVPKQTVPAGHYFVLGDNRPNSSDSHVWGLVPAENIIGRAWVSYWPPNLWGIVPEPVYAR
ncbi:MAG TPA: signal peptidase I [Chloroflexota bacterium]|jgi:signal peptidase I